MRVLLDTHAFLWYCMGDDRISITAKEIIENTSNQPLLSMSSIWEMAIKISIGKLRFYKSFDTLIPEQLDRNGIEYMPIDFQHILPLVQLPYHHRDPFDRLLIAQSLSENIPIVSADKLFDLYSIKRFW